MLTSLRNHYLALALLCVCSASALAQSDRMLFRSKTKPDSTTYLSKDRVPFRVDLPGIWLPAANPAFNYVVVRTEAEPRKLMSFFDYSDGFFSSRFYKSGFSEAQAIEEYYRTESEHQTRRLPESKSQILGKDVDGPVRPNLLWSVESPTLRVYFLTMSKNKRLISISYQDVSPPFGTEEPLLLVFRAMQFPTFEQVDEILRTETNAKP
jgi:hypothetical protein